MGEVKAEYLDMETGKPVLRFTGSPQDVGDAVAVLFSGMANPLSLLSALGTLTVDDATDEAEEQKRRKA